LPRVPRHLANLEAGVSLPQGIRASAAARYAGESYNAATGREKLDDYWLVDLRAQWQIRESLSLQGRVENVGNEKYETVSGYGTLGRTIHLGLRSRF